MGKNKKGVEKNMSKTQTDLLSLRCDPIPKKVYTMEDVDKMMNLIESSNQITIHTWKLGTCNDRSEYEMVKKAVLDALNHPEKFNSSTDTFGALVNLRKKIRKNNCSVLFEEYGLPAKYEYRNTHGINCIVDANNNDSMIVPVTASELLNLIADFNKNHNIEDIYDAYLQEFHHDNVTIEHLELLKKLYYQGKLNKVIKFICTKSNKLGGFVDHGVDIIHSRLTSQYLFDSRRGGDAK